MDFCCFVLFASTQCVRDGCGSDPSFFLLRTQELASYQHESLRKIQTNFNLNVRFDFGGLTMVKRKGLFSLVYFMGEFWLTLQQVLRLGKLSTCQEFSHDRFYDLTTRYFSLYLIKP